MTSKKETFDEKKVEQKFETWAKKLENMDCSDKKGVTKHASSGAAGSIWFFGFVGAAIYFIQQADTFWAGIISILKALVWPGLVVYNLLDFLKI